MLFASHIDKYVLLHFPPVTRDGVKRTIVRDKEYSYDSPVVHRLNKTFEIRPGDDIETICDYSSMSR